MRVITALALAVISIVVQEANCRQILRAAAGNEIGERNCSQAVSITRSQDTHLMLSELKTGTTVFDWIVRKIFEKTAERINRCNNETAFNSGVDISTFPNASFTAQMNHSVVQYGEKKSLFSRSNKHGTIWKDVLTRKTIKSVVAKCAYQDIPAWSPKCIKKLPDLSPLKKVPKVSIAVTMRDPIAATVSFMYYTFGNITSEDLARKILGKRGCKDVIPMIAVRYALTQIIRSYGFNLEIFYYEDLRSNPTLFVYKLSQFLGLVIDDDIISQVIRETSLEATKVLQEETNDQVDGNPEENLSEEIKTKWPGLGDSDRNARKVRSGEIRGYLHELASDALKFCLSVEEFNLPPELYFRYYSNASLVE